VAVGEDEDDDDDDDESARTAALSVAYVRICIDIYGYVWYLGV